MHRLYLPDEYFPVQALFNAIPENRFVKALEAFSNGVGVSYDEATCEFSGEYEEREFEGVRFYIFNEESTITNKEFFDFLSIACDRQIKWHPCQAAEIEKLMSQIRDKFIAA